MGVKGRVMGVQVRARTSLIYAPPTGLRKKKGGKDNWNVRQWMKCQMMTKIYNNRDLNLQMSVNSINNGLIII